LVGANDGFYRVEVTVGISIPLRKNEISTVDAELNFARIFGQLFLVFLRPGFRLPDGVFEHFDHHAIQYTTGLVAGNRAAR